MNAKSQTDNTDDASNGSSALKNQRWEAFAQHIADGKTAKESYRLVFQCALSTARRQSVELSRNPLVRARVRALQEENARNAALGRAETLRILAGIARDTEADTRARIAAIQENNRMNGWSEDRLNVKAEPITLNLGGVLGGD